MVTGINSDETDHSTPGAGAVYVFTRSGIVWGQQVYIKDSRVGWNIKFGYSVSLGGDASTLAVGAIDEDSNAFVCGVLAGHNKPILRSATADYWILSGDLST